MQKKVVFDLSEIDNVSKLIVNKIKYLKTILLRGELGSGKTTFVKSILKNLGVNDNITSPTFSIVNEYRLSQNSFYHFDLYRIENINELDIIGFDEYLDGENICFIEWPEVAMEKIYNRYLDLEIKYISESKREILITEINKRWISLID